MQRIYLLLLLLITCLTQNHAQIYRYIGMEDGLSSRRVIAIEQGVQDYIWILTHKGVDRYDGKFFSHYKLTTENQNIHFYPDLNKLDVDSEGTLWEYGKDGYIFRYNEIEDRFIPVFNLKKTYPSLSEKPIKTIYMDSKGIFWFCCETKLVRYDSKLKESTLTEHFLEDHITTIAEGDNNQYFFAAASCIYSCLFKKGNVEILEKRVFSDIQLINYIYLHKKSNTLIISTLLNGLFLYDMNSGQTTNLETSYKDVGVNAIKPYYKSPYEVLIATNGDGVYLLNIKEKKLVHFLKEDYEQDNKMDGSIIKDICVDKSNQIWNVIYPKGLTVYSEKYENYEWLRRNPTKKESLVDNRINAIIQDSEGDIWFATCNGISCYSPKEKHWKNYLYEGTKEIHNDNRIFISLCEGKPGIILAGGYMSGTYQINKHTGKVGYTLQPNISKGIYPDKYIRSIYHDHEDILWGGGYYTLRSYDIKTHATHLYRAPYPITYIHKKNDMNLWIGTINGLYTFNKSTQQMQEYPLPKYTGCINSIYQTPDDALTYVATYGNGLYIINNNTGTNTNLNKDNCGLITNNIYSIVPNRDNNLFLGTENGLAYFNTQSYKATHWTKEQGLLSASFNQNAAVKTRDGRIFLGTNEGAIVIADSMKLPMHFSSHMILENLHIMYRNVHPNSPGSPLKELLDKTSVLRLKYNQNTFSLNVNSINFDNPSNITYSWKLEGFYNEWSAPSSDNLIRYTNLSPGSYTLKVRAHLLDNNQFLEERSIQIIVGKPFWLTYWAFMLYFILLMVTVYYVKRNIDIRKDRHDSQAKINFFIQTAHDIRTPLTLIKAPLGEILKTEQLTEEGLINLNLAIQNTDNLSELANNLMNFQKEELYSSKLNVEKEELNQYLSNYLKHFESYAKQKGLNLVYTSNFQELEVWIDRNKMDSILRNLLSNALKYTPKDGTVSIRAEHNKRNWSLTITDTGIGISQKDQSKLFKFLFRGENATNQMITGAGVGMLLTYRLIQNHLGKISFISKENTGTSFYLSFPLKSKHYQYIKKEDMPQVLTSVKGQQENGVILWEDTDISVKHPENAPYILIVEDNTQLRVFLKQALADTYVTEGAENGSEALTKIHQQQPDLIISDVMMPGMDGHELCKRLKSNLTTSHIPIILLTALGDREDILCGLECKADQYIVKPFDLTMLKANISNLLENRVHLRQQLQKTFINNLKREGQIIEDSSDSLSSLDDEFILQVTQLIKEGLSKGLNVDSLCSSLNMSRTSFYHKIKALTGAAPAELIRNIRIEEAAVLLKSHRYSVAEVSQLLGFADPKYFTDTFKKHYGITPSAFMKQEKKSDTKGI